MIGRDHRYFEVDPCSSVDTETPRKMAISTTDSIAIPKLADATVLPGGLPEEYKYKNQLQEYTHKSKIPLPVYQTVNEGPLHAPKFKGVVVVDGITFKASKTFLHRKAAEQDVAFLALEYLKRRKPPEGFNMHVEAIFCKSILHEYAVKINAALPLYSTSTVDGLAPMFICTVVFNGKTYKGPLGKNKKEAEQMAARTVINSILGESSSWTLISPIIKAKDKLLAFIEKHEATKEVQIVLPSLVPTSVSGPCLQQFPCATVVPHVGHRHATDVGGSSVDVPCKMEGVSSVVVVDGCSGFKDRKSLKRKRKNKRLIKEEPHTEEQYEFKACVNGC